MKSIFFLSLCVLIIACTNNHKKNIKLNKKSTIENTKLISNLDSNKETLKTDTLCLNSDKIAEILDRYSNENNINKIDAKNFYTLLKQNDLDESDCHYPRNNFELDLLNKFTVGLLNSTDSSDKAILLLFYISESSTRIIDLIEFIQSKLAYLIINNTQGYINMVSMLNPVQQIHAIAAIELIKTKEELINLKAKIDIYRNNYNSQIIDKIITQLNEELGR